MTEKINFDYIKLYYSKMILAFINKIFLIKYSNFNLYKK